jgi:hypothetical protein
LKSQALFQSTAGVAKVTCALGILALSDSLKFFVKIIKLNFWEEGKASKSILTPSAPASNT